jgi:dTDP-4-amino-4,6-dideoxygalactose transaminase
MRPPIDTTAEASTLQVPFFRTALTDAEVAEVVACLRSGWLTTGPRTRQFETEFATAVGAPHAVALNSCTAALHLAVEALGLRPGDAVLVPTMTFAATAEVVRYQGAVPILVDCDPVTGNMDLADAERKLRQAASGDLPAEVPPTLRPVGVMPVHVGGHMLDVAALAEFAAANGLWVVEDAAHAFPAAWRPSSGPPWQRCGADTARITCFSFYANKTLTTGEGGMAVTAEPDLANRMRMMSLHGLSNDAWGRYAGRGKWDYRILAPGFKYNLTDVAAALGLGQLARAEQMRLEREAIARRFIAAFAGVDEIELPAEHPDRILSWHLFPIRLRLDRLAIDRNAFFDDLRSSGVGCSVHWRPLHLHPYYEQTYGWAPESCPQATALWQRLISLPIFPGMREDEIARVIAVVSGLCRQHARPGVGAGRTAP